MGCIQFANLQLEMYKCRSKEKEMVKAQTQEACRNTFSPLKTQWKEIKAGSDGDRSAEKCKDIDNQSKQLLVCNISPSSKDFKFAFVHLLKTSTADEKACVIILCEYQPVSESCVKLRHM